MIGARNRDVACRTIYFDIVTAASAVVHHSQWSSCPSSAVKNPSSKNAVVGIADWLVECWNNSLFSVEWMSECGEEADGPNGGMVGIETSIFRRHECTGQALWKSVGFVRPCPAAYIVNVEELLVESWWDFGCPHSFCLVDSFVDSVFS